ncbi:MAG: 2'-5' RNA ligase family protein [Acidobacteriota bacterium]
MSRVGAGSEDCPLTMPGQLSLDGFEQRPLPLINLFFALKPDEQAAMQSAEVARLLGREQGVEIKQDRIDRFHVTLFHVGHFQGEIPASTLAAASACAQFAAEVQSFPVVFDKVASFSGRSGNLPIVLRGAERCDALMRFQSGLDDRMKRAGLVHGESRGHFTPHLTLFYGRTVAERAIEPIGWRATELVLLSSVHGAGLHRPEGCWPLRDAA